MPVDADPQSDLGRESVSLPAPRVSVVIPAYNAAQFIAETLDSVRAQTYPSYEVVVVDDGSTDGTQAVVEDYFARHGLPGRCLGQANKKIAGARNVGMRAARGEFIALLDHDDLWRPNKLESVLREFERHPDADLVCHAEDITRAGRRVKTLYYGPAGVDLYERLLFKGNALSPSASVFRRDKALAIGGFRENPEFNTVEDYDFWMRFSRVASFRFVDDVLGQYQLVDRAASRQIEYHHANLESLLRDHLSAYGLDHPGLWNRLRSRYRLSRVYRSALWQLWVRRSPPTTQRRYVLNMLQEFPWAPQHWGLALFWSGFLVLRHGAEAAGMNSRPDGKSP